MGIAVAPIISTDNTLFLTVIYGFHMTLSLIMCCTNLSSYSLHYDSIEQFCLAECEGGVRQLSVREGSHQHITSRGWT